MHDLTLPVSPQRTARRVVAHGRVQGVFFRDSTRQVAVNNDVTGWVVNRPDGTVEAWLEGAPDAVARVEGWIRGGGPPQAHVDRVTAQTVPPAGHDAFEVR